MARSDTKSAAEREFDTRIAASPVLDYDFSRLAPRSKDGRIVERLTEYGVAGRHCLDIGPGTGRWLTFLRRQEAGYTSGVDFSATVLERVAPLCDRTQKANLEREPLDFPDDSFDIVLSIEVLEHLREPDLLLAEIVRVARPGACVLMSIPNIVSLAARVRILFGLLPPAIASDPTHVRFYRQKDLRRLFSRHGQTLRFLPTSISPNPFVPKSRFRIPSVRWLSQFDDSILFTFDVDKGGRAAGTGA